ncbi:MAG: 50S ribosomal protein L12 [Candidatus Atabeyarchaeum deiterrae]|jgi:large subunit ribosomal protein L12
MESVYASLLLHKAGQKISEDKIEKILQAAGASVDKTQIKATVAALEGINIADAIKTAAITAVAAPEAGATKKEDKKKEDEKKEEEAVAGLGALFG